MTIKVPTITEPRRMNIKEAIQWAMEGQERLIDAQVRICIWETERIVERARDHSTWDTCFHRCLWDLQVAWDKKQSTARQRLCTCKAVKP